MNRPLRLEYVQAKTIALNPRNWRTHPKAQLDALKAVMADVGWADALKFNERTGRLVDGHGRIKVTDPEAFVPVLIGNWTERQEAKILATLDPLAGMAGADAGKLQDLLDDVDLSDDAFEGLNADFDELMKGLNSEFAAEEAGGGGGSGSGEGARQASWKVVVDCTSEDDRRDVIARLRDEGRRVKPLGA